MFYVYTEPEFEEFPRDTHVTEGEEVFFAVKVNGQPQPTLIWYCDGKGIQSDYSQGIKTDGSLSLPSTETRHTGVYQLVAKNSVGSAEKEGSCLSTSRERRLLPFRGKVLI